MIEELKKKSLKASLPATIVFIIIGVVLAVIFGKNIASSIKGFETFEQLTPDEIKDQLVEADININFGSYLEQYSKNTSTGKRTTEALYYVIWTGDDYAEDYRYMSIKVPVRFENQMEQMADNADNDMYSDPIHFAGTIKKLTNEEYQYFKKYFIAAGWTEDEIAAETLPYYIEVTGSGSASSMKGFNMVMLALILLCAVIAIVRIIKASTGAYLKKFTKDYEEAGYTEATIESDYSRAYTFAKSPISIGNLCTYWTGPTVPRVMANKDLAWAYQNTTTHRTNGIKTGTTYSVELLPAQGKGSFSIPVRNEAAAQEILQKIQMMMPWVFVGYGDELKRTYNKNRAEFLDIKYNKCEHVVGAAEPYEASKSSYWDPYGGNNNQ